MSEKKYASLEANYDDIVKHALEDCILCGECVSNCLTFPLTPLNNQHPEEIMEKMTDFLRDRDAPQDVHLKAYSCAGCGYCSDSCPQELDPLLIHEAVKIELVKEGNAPPEPVNFVLPGQKFNIYEILSALQMKPSEARWLKSAPAQPEKIENVVFLGCSPVALPDKIFAFLDVLEKMGTRFVALSGGDLCCGTSLSLAAGKPRESEAKARELVDALEAFSPERVILTCTGCYRNFTEFFPNFMDFNFETQFYTQFLMENMEKMNFTKPLQKTVALHESCMTRRTKVSNSARKVLERIPGLTLMKSEHEKEKALCCGGIANMTNPPVGQGLAQELVNWIKKTNADYIANTCPFCRLALYPHARQKAFEVKDIATLINESMGGKEYEDKLETYWEYESVEEIIEKSKENFEECGYTEQEMRQILPLLFPFAKP
jgi:Fe-S oxidoreductase